MYQRIIVLLLWKFWSLPGVCLVFSFIHGTSLMGAEHWKHRFEFWWGDLVNITIWLRWQTRSGKGQSWAERQKWKQQSCEYELELPLTQAKSFLALMDPSDATAIHTFAQWPHRSCQYAGVWEILCRESCGTSSTVSVSCAPSCFYGSIDEQRGRHGCFSWSLWSIWKCQWAHCEHLYVFFVQIHFRRSDCDIVIVNIVFLVCCSLL